MNNKIMNNYTLVCINNNNKQCIDTVNILYRNWNINLLNSINGITSKKAYCYILEEIKQLLNSSNTMDSNNDLFKNKYLSELLKVSLLLNKNENYIVSVE